MSSNAKLYAANAFRYTKKEHLAALDEAEKLLNTHGEEKGGRSSNDNYFRTKIEPNTIFLYGLNKHVRGNLQYILDELNHNKRYKKFKIYVRTSADTDASVKQFIKEHKWKRTTTVPTNGKSSKMMESCQFLLTEVHFPSSWIKRPGQTYINIWHGTPLKKLGLAKNLKNIPKNGVTQRDFMEADYLLYPNDYTRDNMLASYKVQSMMHGKILMLGYPRTGGMLAMTEEELTALRNDLAPNGEKLYAYMPTFRDYLPDDKLMEQCTSLLDYLDAHLRDDQILYVNLHHRISVGVDYSAYHHIRQFPAQYGNYQVLMACQALITDYSSVFFDYLATGKQIILHVEDYDVYSSKRGTYMDLLELPLDKAYSSKEVLDALNRGKTYDDTEARQKFCGYDSAQNAAKLCQLFVKDESGLTLLPIEKDDSQKTLLFSEDLHDCPSNDLLNRFVEQYDRSKATVYLSCDVVASENNKDSSYPMLFNTPGLGVDILPRLTGVATGIRSLYTKGKLPFSQAIRYLAPEYALMKSRFYGAAPFQQIIVYDVQNPETLIGLSETRISQRILFVQRDMLDQIKNGNTFMKDALRYSAPFYHAVFAASEEDAKEAAELLKGCWNHPIPVLSTPEALNDLLSAQFPFSVRLRRKLGRLKRKLLKR